MRVGWLHTGPSLGLNDGLLSRRKALEERTAPLGRKRVSLLILDCHPALRYLQESLDSVSIGEGRLERLGAGASTRREQHQ